MYTDLKVGQLNTDFSEFSGINDSFFLSKSKNR